MTFFYLLNTVITIAGIAGGCLFLGLCPGNRLLRDRTKTRSGSVSRFIYVLPHYPPSPDPLFYASLFYLSGFL